MRRYGGLMIQKITKIICDNCGQSIFWLTLDEILCWGHIEPNRIKERIN